MRSKRHGLQGWGQTRRIGKKHPRWSRQNPGRVLLQELRSRRNWMGSKNSDWLPRHLAYSLLFNAAGRQSSHYFDFKKHSEVESPLYSGNRSSFWPRGYGVQASLPSVCLPSPGSLQDLVPTQPHLLGFSGDGWPPSGPVQLHLVSLTRLQAPWGFLDFDSKECLCSRVEAEGFLWGSCGGWVSQ